MRVLKEECEIPHFQVDADWKGTLDSMLGEVILDPDQNKNVQFTEFEGDSIPKTNKFI